MLVSQTMFAGRYTHFSKFKTVIEGVMWKFYHLHARQPNRQGQGGRGAEGLNISTENKIVEISFTFPQKLNPKYWLSSLSFNTRETLFCTWHYNLLRCILISRSETMIYIS